MWRCLALMSKVTFLSTFKASLRLGLGLVLCFVEAILSSNVLHLLTHVANPTSIKLHHGVHEEITLEILASCESLQAYGEITLLLLQFLVFFQ